MSLKNLPLILIVDDQLANLTILELTLISDYRLFCVSSGQAALDVLVQAPFDLVLLDIMMPVMSGFEVLEFIRSNPKTVDLPVILISALADARNITRGLEMGANDYITKPIDIDITRARVQTQTRLKCLEDERKHTIVQLQEAQQMKDRFLQIASHDLKGPLQNIRMVASLMDRMETAIPDVTVLLEALESSVTTMETVIVDFLDTAALETGALHLNIEPIVVNQVVQALTTEYAAHAARKNITLHIEPITGIICGDAARFQQALGNLVSNAIKYSPMNTTVRLWTENIGAIQRICVADEGPGIPQHEQERLFTEFGKLSPRPTGGESSTGLGLWIVKHLITLQEGQIGVHSSPGNGSVFWIEMPSG